MGSAWRSLLEGCGFEPHWELGIFYFIFVLLQYGKFSKLQKNCFNFIFFLILFNHVLNLGIIPTKFLWAFDHSFNDPRPLSVKKKFFLTIKKIFFDPPKIFFSIFFLFFKHHRNYGDIMPGFGTW